MFELAPQLRQDCILLGHFPLSLLLLMNDSRYPWFILVPQRNGIREIFQLAASDRQRLMAESCTLAEALSKHFAPDKLNVAAIGNLVPQLHLHHVVRYRTDAAWPAPVWGKLPPMPYENGQLDRLRQAIRELGMVEFRTED